MARAASLLAERLGDDASRAAGLRALGHVYYRKRKYEASLDLYQESLAIYQRLGDALEAGRTLNSSLQSLIYLGRYPEAMDYAEQAREIFERLGDRLRLARLDANMGNILYRQDRFEEALELYRARVRRLREDRRAAGYRHLAQEYGHLPDQPERLSGSPGNLPEGARLLRPGKHAGAGGGGRLQHRLPLLPARRVHAIHRTLSRGARELPRRWATRIARPFAIWTSRRCTWS